MTKYPTYCSITESNDCIVGMNDRVVEMNDSIVGMNDSIVGMNDSIVGMNDSIVGMNDSIVGMNDPVGVETHGRASLRYDTGRAFPQHDTNNPTNDNPLECDNVNFFQL